MTTPTLPGFYGRNEELAWLRGLWDACTARDPTTGRYAGGPRMAVVVAESGVGKSRLVQALYQQLTVDPAWDPPDVNYWPDAFQSPGDSLRVNPDPHGHEPKAPPQFLWLGLRWQPTDLRNVEERICRLPEARDALRAHVTIADRYRTVWEHARSAAARAVRTEGVGEAVGQAADAVGSNIGIPFGGLIFKLAQGAAGLVSDRSKGERQLSREQKSQQEDAAEEFISDLREVFGGPGSAGRVLPTVLWLDDAQWIDVTTLRCVRMLLAEARQRRWPLLVVVTHWEREWRELQNAEAAPVDADLPALARGLGAEVRMLGAGAADAMDGLVLSRLPGLTTPQRQLLLQKAGGNFLSMVENVGELLSNPDAFEGGSAEAPLNSAGETFVREWESERQKRVEQRFSRLASEVKTLLGWGSALGVRFLREVVEDYASRALPQHHASTVLSGCVDPYAILGTPSPYVREFRDRAFHAVARKHFDRWGGAHAQALRVVLREHLVRWVNGSFDGDGLLLRALDEPTWGIPSPAAIFLESDERRALLQMAVEQLPLSEDPDWNRETDTAALRARILLVFTDGADHLYEEVRAVARGLESVRWAGVPESVLSFDGREILADELELAGALGAAMALIVDRLARARRVQSELGMASSRYETSIILRRVGSIEEACGDLDGAMSKFLESLDISRRLAEDFKKPWILREVSASLDRVGGIEQAHGNLGGALSRYLESLEIRRRLAEEVGTPESLRDVSISLDLVGRIEQERGDLDGAMSKFMESLEICRRRAAKTGTPENLRDISICLSRVGSIEEARGDLDGAMSKFVESLEIDRRLAEEVATPQSLRDMSIGLDRVGIIEQERGDLDGALSKFMESLEIRRRLAEEVATPQSLQDVSISLELLGAIAEARRDLEEAHSRYAESLEIRRRLEEKVATPGSRRGLSVSLSNVGRVARARGDLEGAVSKYAESLGIRRRLAEEFPTSASLRALTLNLDIVARLERARGELDGAFSKYAESLEIRRRLAKELGTAESLRDVSVCLSKIGDIEQLRKILDGARSCYEESFEIRLALVSRLASSGALADLDAILLRLAKLERSCGRLVRARAYYGEIDDIRLYVGRAEAHDGFLDSHLGAWLQSLPLHEREVIKLYTGIGDGFRYTLNEIGRIFRVPDGRAMEIVDAASDALRDLLRESNALSAPEDSAPAMVDGRGVSVAKQNRLLSVSREMVDKVETPDALRDLCVRLNDVAFAKELDGDLEAALPLFVESREVARRLVAMDAAPDFLRDLGTCCENVARVEQARGNLAEALTHYKESKQLQQRLVDELGTEDNLNNLVWVAQLVAAVELALARPEAAILSLASVQCHQQALESATEANTLDTAATYLERFVEALDALGRSGEAAESRRRTAVLRARIAQIGG